MFGFKKKKKVLLAPVSGKSISIENVEDDTFSKKIMGDGIAFIPSNGVLVSPCDGTISMIMEESKHAIGINSKDGVQLLLHVGLDTVNLKGQGFELMTSVGQNVKAGDELIHFNKEFIEGQDISVTTILVILEESAKIEKSYTDISVESGNTIIIEYQ